MILSNAWDLCITAAAGTELAVPFSGSDQLPRVLGAVAFITLTGVYIPKYFVLHAASLPQAFAHWGRFVAAAPRRSLASVSVPVARVVLSHPLGILALVSRYLTNKLIGHRPLLGRNHTFGPETLSGITYSFP